MPIARPRRGRASKFGRPSHAVTITLPDDVVTSFRAVDPDLSRAIVHASGIVAARGAGPSVALSRYGSSAVIVIAPNRLLEELPGVALVPLPDGRALISLHKDTSVAEFECCCATRSSRPIPRPRTMNPSKPSERFSARPDTPAACT